MLRAKLDGEASRVCLRPAHAGPQRQRGGSGLHGFPEVLRETAIPQREHSQRVGRREVPLAGVCIPGVRNVAPATPVTDGAGTQPPSSLASLVSGVCVLRPGFGKFQHLCCCALWSLEGNRDFGSVFTSGHLLHQGMSAVGGREGRLESVEREEGQKAWLLDAGRQLLGGGYPGTDLGEKGTG